MTRGQAVAAAAAVITAAAAVAWSGGLRISLHAGASTGAADATPAAAEGAWEGGQCLPGRHGLYRRHDGHKMRRQLVDGGWDWYLNPPGEASL